MLNWDTTRKKKNSLQNRRHDHNQGIIGKVQLQYQVYIITLLGTRAGRTDCYPQDPTVQIPWLSGSCAAVVSGAYRPTKALRKCKKLATWTNKVSK